LTYATFFDILVAGGVKMNERLKLLRKELKYNQDLLGTRLGVTKTAISKMELGTYNITDSMVKLICKEFNVNEDWLRTGQGEMFRTIPEEDEVAAYVSELLEDDGSNPIFAIIKEVMHTYNQLDDKSQGVLNDYAHKLLSNLKNIKIEG
jgi:transcriptional regulator with XRE-family HTH domain